MRQKDAKKGLAMMEPWVAEVDRFWFEELPSEAWFRRDEAVDAAIRARFGKLYERLKREGATHAATTPEGAVAAVIVLDQFPRNMFRDSPAAYATDAAALALAKQAVAAGFDHEMEPRRRQFLYLPFMHSEDRAMQARSVALYRDLGDAEALDYALRHQAIIDRFGRFPHRNAVLGRASTAAEIEFLKTNPGF
jgi:uncharacterized protein (DUF924 family)